MEEVNDVIVQPPMAHLSKLVRILDTGKLKMLKDYITVHLGRNKTKHLSVEREAALVASLFFI